MRLRRFILIAVLLAPLGAALPSFAQPYPGKGYPPDKGRMMVPPGKQGDMERMRDGPGQGYERPVHDRLSPEERRQLRRDIDQHGRELYRGRHR